MDNNLLEQWQKLGRSGLEASRELEAINTDVMQKLTGAQMELANATFELGSRYMAGLGDAEGYQDALAEQTKLLSEYNEKLIETARATADAVSEAREAYQGWMEKSIQNLGGLSEFNLAGFEAANKKAPAQRKAA